MWTSDSDSIYGTLHHDRLLPHLIMNRPRPPQIRKATGCTYNTHVQLQWCSWWCTCWARCINSNLGLLPLMLPWTSAAGIRDTWSMAKCTVDVRYTMSVLRFLLTPTMRNLQPWQASTCPEMHFPDSGQRSSLQSGAQSRLHHEASRSQSCQILYVEKHSASQKLTCYTDWVTLELPKAQHNALQPRLSASRIRLWCIIFILLGRANICIT